MSTSQTPNNAARDLPPLYSLTAIGIGTFLGSALAAGYMLASNYAALQQRKPAQYALAASIVFVVLLLFLQYLWVTTIQAAIILMFVQIALALVVVNKLQGAMFASYEKMGGKYYSNWRAVLVGIGASFALTFVSLLVFTLSGAPAPGP